jgi:hypothetical protein
MNCRTNHLTDATHLKTEQPCTTPIAPPRHLLLQPCS